MSEADAAAGALDPEALLLGHDAVLAQVLASWRAGRLHHAWLLTGPQGIGKATLAARLAGLLSGARVAGPAPDRPTVDPSVAARMRAGAQATVKLLAREPDDKGKLRSAISVDQVRRLGSFLNQTAVDGHWRVILVDAAEDMNREAANALLKMLEEPPAGVVFLLVSHRPGRLLPTIRSRCRTLACQPLSEAAMTAVLTRSGAPEREAMALAALADGCPGRVLQWIELDVPALDAALDEALALKGPERAARVLDLAAKLSAPAQRLRYEAFLDLVQLRLARAVRALARGGPGDRQAQAWGLAGLEQAGTVWEKARALASAATGLMLDPAAVIVRLFALFEPQQNEPG